MEELLEFVFDDLGNVFAPQEPVIPVDDIFWPTDPSIPVDLVLTGVTDALAGEVIA